MRLTSLRVDNLFSFDHLTLDFSADATILLGPNGSGKTNVLRAIDLAATALRWAAEEHDVGNLLPALGPAGQSLQAYFDMSHEGRGGRRRVEVGLELDQEDERSLILSFLRAALAWSLRNELQSSGSASPIDSWVTDEITPERVACLTRGTLVAEHSGVPGRRWEVGYDFAPAGEGLRWRWILAAPTFQNSVVRLDGASQQPNHPDAQSTNLLQALFGLADAPSANELPDQLPPLDLNQVLGGDPAGPLTLGRRGGTIVDWSSPPVLDFLTRFGASHPPANILPTEQAWTIAGVLHRLWQERVFTVGEQLRGVGRWGEPVAPVGSYDLIQLASALRTSEVPLLPARLFRLLNGSAEERERFQASKCTFHQLTGGRSLALRATPLPPRADHDSSGETTGLPA